MNKIIFEKATEPHSVRVIVFEGEVIFGDEENPVWTVRDIIEFGNVPSKARAAARNIAIIVESNSVTNPTFVQKIEFGRAKTLASKIEKAIVQTMNCEGRSLPMKENIE